jgi:hypothetical protein
MDIKQSLDYKTEIYQDIKKYNTLGNKKYDYQREGVLRHTLPKILFKGNSILVTFLQLIDLKIIMTLKYIERLKRFKYISWY